MLNPSGMSLGKAYNVEGAYAYGERLGEHFLHASVVDSTSETNIAGGLYYTYHAEEHPTGAIPGHGHEAGFALSIPAGKVFTLGATLKWFRFEGSDNGLAVSDPAARGGGLTFDVGATVRPAPMVSIGLVGTNLRDLGPEQASPLVGYGVAYSPLPQLVVDVDGVTYLRDSSRTRTGVRAGGEATVAQRVSVRLGGGTDPRVGVGYLAAGASVLSEIGAVDVGVRGDLFPYGTGTTRDLFLGVSLRLFVPGAVASAQAASSPP